MPRVNQGKYKKYHNEFNATISSVESFCNNNFANGYDGTASDFIEEGNNLYVKAKNLSINVKEMISNGEKFEMEKNRKKFETYLPQLNSAISHLVDKCNWFIEVAPPSIKETGWIKQMEISIFLNNI